MPFVVAVLAIVSGAATIAFGIRWASDADLRDKILKNTNASNRYGFLKPELLEAYAIVTGGVLLCGGFYLLIENL